MLEGPPFGKKKKEPARLGTALLLDDSGWHRYPMPVVEQSTHSAGDPEVLGSIPGVIDAAGPAVPHSPVRESRDEPREATRMYGTG